MEDPAGDDTDEQGQEGVPKPLGGPEMLEKVISSEISSP
jgi:hypothetical protein